MSALASLVGQTVAAAAPVPAKRRRRAPAPGSDLGGRPFALSDEARERAQALLAEGKLSQSQIAAAVGGKRHHIADMVRRAKDSDGDFYV